MKTELNSYYSTLRDREAWGKLSDHGNASLARIVEDCHRRGVRPLSISEHQAMMRGE